MIAPTADVAVQLVLASTSTHRQRLLEAAGIRFRIEPPDFDERELEARLGDLAVEELAVELALGKARSVAPRLRHNEWALGADQLAVLNRDTRPELLYKAPDLAAAVEQLLRLSGTTHQLVNGLALWNPASDRVVTGTDVHEVRMRRFSRADAVAYVERFRPLDSVGCYRIEDDADLLAGVSGSGDDGVQGLPGGLLRSMLAEAGSG